MHKFFVIVASVFTILGLAVVGAGFVTVYGSNTSSMLVASPEMGELPAEEGGDSLAQIGELTDSFGSLVADFGSAAPLEEATTAGGNFFSDALGSFFSSFGEKPTGAVPPTSAETAPAVAGEVVSVAGHSLRIAEFTMNDDNYSAERFGGWASIGNSCDVRDYILDQDLTEKIQNGCDMKAGNLVDPYTGKQVYWETGNKAVDIDHVFSRSNAWSAGASEWSEQQLKDFSNDSINLLATDASVNKWKSDRLPADVLANGGFTNEGKCAYVKVYAETAQKYNLAVTSADAQAMVNTWAAAGC